MLWMPQMQTHGPIRPDEALPTPTRPTGKPLLDRLAGIAGDRPAVWLMRQAGRYLPEYRRTRSRVRHFLELCYTPDLAAEVTLQPLRRFPLDAAILFSDILVVPDALGHDVRFVEGEGPRLARLRTGRDLDGLDATRLHAHLQPVYETIRLVRAQLGAEVALIGFAGAPWTLAAYMIEGGGSKDFQAARLLVRHDPGLVDGLIDLLTRSVIELLDGQVRAGAEVVQLFDSWAGVLSPPQFLRFCVEPARRIVGELARLHPGVPVIVFPRGAGAGYLDMARRAGSAGLGLDTTVPMGWAVSELAPHVRCLQGNLDPLALLGPEAALLDEAKAIVEAGAGTPLIFNLGHGVVPETPPERVGTLVSYLQSLAE
jgi:uroporphyrinogen decarboxylase